MAISRNASVSSMMKPNIYEPYAFDATNNYVFMFTYSGPQAQYNRLVIKDNATETVVYDKTIATMDLSHTVFADTLMNGKVYKAFIYVYDKNYQESPASSPVLFSCFTQPTFQFTNFPDDGIVKNSSFPVEFEYVQPEGELLNSYRVILYSSLGDVISEVTRYSNEETVFSHTFASLSTDTSYSIQVIGETRNHMTADSGKIGFSVEYTLPNVFVLLDLVNLKKEGQIKIQSNIVAILGKSYPDPIGFLDGLEVDLTGKDAGGQHRVWFDEGFDLQSNFTLQTLVRHPTCYEKIIEFGAYPITLELKYMKGCFDSRNGRESGYIALRVYNQITNYYIQSNYFEPLSHPFEYLHIWLRCVNDVYELVAEPVMTEDMERFMYLNMSPLDVAKIG